MWMQKKIIRDEKTCLKSKFDQVSVMRGIISKHWLKDISIQSINNASHDVLNSIGQLYTFQWEHTVWPGLIQSSTVCKCDMDIRMCLWCVYLCRGMNPIKGGVQCERISQTPFDSLEQLYLNKATILWENPSNLLIPISVFGLRDSSIVLICFCLSEAAEGF